MNMFTTVLHDIAFKLKSLNLLAIGMSQTGVY